jgi:hypothetical protein
MLFSRNFCPDSFFVASPSKRYTVPESREASKLSAGPGAGALERESDAATSRTDQALGRGFPAVVPPLDDEGRAEFVDAVGQGDALSRPNEFHRSDQIEGFGARTVTFPLPLSDETRTEPSSPTTTELSFVVMDWPKITDLHWNCGGTKEGEAVPPGACAYAKPMPTKAMATSAAHRSAEKLDNSVLSRLAS